MSNSEIFHDHFNIIIQLTSLRVVIYPLFQPSSFIYSPRQRSRTFLNFFFTCVLVLSLVIVCLISWIFSWKLFSHPRLNNFLPEFRFPCTFLCVSFCVFCFSLLPCCNRCLVFQCRLDFESEINNRKKKSRHRILLLFDAPQGWITSLYRFKIKWWRKW